MTIPAADRPYLAAAANTASSLTPDPDRPAAGRAASPLRSIVGRHPVATFLLTAYAIFWLSWTPVLFLGASPRLFSALGALLGLAVPAFLVTAVTEGRPGVRDLVGRTLRWRVGIGWYLLATLAIPVGALLLAPLFLGSAPLEALGRSWPVLFTDFLPQLVLAVVTVQLFEELGWAGFVQHRLQARHGALRASVLVALAFALLHLPTYLRAPISGPSALRDLSVLVIVIPFAICFRILITYAYNRTASAVLLTAVTHASFNEASELIGPNVQGSLGQVLAFASTALLAVLAVAVSRGRLGYRRVDRGSTRETTAEAPAAS
jgi:uncharacterized protein